MTSSTALALASAAGGLSVSVSRFLGLVRFGRSSLEIPLQFVKVNQYSNTFGSFKRLGMFEELLPRLLCGGGRSVTVPSKARLGRRPVEPPPDGCLVDVWTGRKSDIT